MKIGVIGGGGFIGKHVTKELIARGYEVIIFDKFKPSMDVPFEEIDILDIATLREKLINVDGVIHLAALVGVDNCRSNEEDVVRVNFEGTKNIVEVCIENGIDKLLFSSSSEVYGDGVSVPFKENDVKIPKSAYGKAKLMSEDFLKEYANNSFKVRVVRYFNVYGSQQNDNFVISKFLKQTHNGENMTIYGDGQQIRCFSYISDIVNGTILAFEYEGENFADFNIGNNKPISMEELAGKINELMGNKSEIEFLNLGDKGVRDSNIEIFRRIPSIEKAQLLLNYQPVISLNKGLEIIIEEKYGNTVSIS
ncbi:NAD-dependent epimerase/dehydratase family protein [Bacillus mycoides]|uniref:NAD-dependent epimerase/dehydratase family protein n=1 Tax=Bacillus mycoides TaxID=1405 RepID=UPI001C02A58E|nr:NAD-dependent epimerase/dehydratase family protein [Bacillus mycoides]QWG87438.1 NAD-dependent epimerase/dehydratase family protein [Bacillus mycoides]